MSWIRLPADTETSDLERSTAEWRDRGVEVPTVIAAMKHNPGALDAVMNLSRAVTFGGSVLGRRREELIASAVSAYNSCFY